jgi:hypothetical protein
MTKYYNIKLKDKPKAYGFAVAIKKGKLENITAGEEANKKYGVSLDKKGNLVVGKNSFYIEINKIKAEELREDEYYWRMTQLYFSDYACSSHIGKGGEFLY